MTEQDKQKLRQAGYTDADIADYEQNSADKTAVTSSTNQDNLPDTLPVPNVDMSNYHQRGPAELVAPLADVGGHLWDLGEAAIKYGLPSYAAYQLGKQLINKPAPPAPPVNVRDSTGVTTMVGSS